MPGGDNGLGVVLLHGFYGVVAYVVSWFVHRLITTYRVPKDARRWAIELEADIVRLINAHTEVAMCDIAVAEKIQKVPKGLDAFEHPILTAGRLGFVVQDAVRIRCEQLGLPYPRSWQTGHVPSPAAEPEPFTIDASVTPPSNAVMPSAPPSPLPSPPRLPAHTATGPVFVIGPDGRAVPRGYRQQAVARVVG